MRHRTPYPLLLAGAALAPGACCEQEGGGAPPNIVFILADDLGWGDLGCYGQQFFSTPNIDGLAANGIRFTQCYSGTSVSAPSRSCLLTGMHSGHTHIRGNLELAPEGQFPLPEGIQTIFSEMKKAGYRTGAFGKWGLGFIGTSGEPSRQGIDEFYGFNCQKLAHSYYADHIWHNSVRIDLPDNTDSVPYGEGTYVPDLIHRKALEFHEGSVKEGRPFFLWYPTTIPHAELIAPRDSILQRFIGTFPETPYSGTDSGPGFRTGGYCSQEYPRATFAAMVTRLDVYVGEIIATLKTLGVYDNTLIIFSSDNGPHREGGADPDYFDSNGPWRGYKRDLYEGGIRVPMIVSWPGRADEGTESDFVCSFWDLMPTFREVAGVPVNAGTDGRDDASCGTSGGGKAPRGTDGISLLPLLEGRDGQEEHEYLYFEFQEMGGRQAVRKGDWKALCLNVRSEAPVYELYNLADDPGETTDLSGERPDILSALKDIMEEAHIPNPDFPLLRGEFY